MNGTCPECLGTGKHLFIEQGHYEEVRCFDCNGRGVREIDYFDHANCTNKLIEIRTKQKLPELQLVKPTIFNRIVRLLSR